MELSEILKNKIKLPNGFIYGAIIAGFCLIGLFIALGRDLFGALNLMATMVVVGLLLKKTGKEPVTLEKKLSFSKPVKHCLECGSSRRHKNSCSKFKPKEAKP